MLERIFHDKRHAKEECQPADPQGVGNPVRVRQISRRRDRCVDKLDCFGDPPARLETVDVRRQPVTAGPAEACRHCLSQLDIAVEVSAVDLAQRLDECRVPGFAGFVSGGRLQLRGTVGIGRRRLGAPDEACVTGRGVEAGEPRNVRGVRLQQLFRPGHRLEEVDRKSHQRRVGRDVGGDR